MVPRRGRGTTGCLARFQAEWTPAARKARQR